MVFGEAGKPNNHETGLYRMQREHERPKMSLLGYVLAIKIEGDAIVRDRELDVWELQEGHNPSCVRGRCAFAARVNL
jgi:hypothetical protein